MCVLLDPHEGRVIVRQHRLGEQQQIAHALEAVIEIAVSQDQHQRVADLTIGAIAERLCIGSHKVLQRAYRHLVVRIQLQAGLRDVRLQHQVRALFLTQREEVAIQPLELLFEGGRVGGFM
ncbi:hypothetical protein D9M70_445770 [compost metagenome]